MTIRIAFKGCPKCEGDVSLDRDQHGPYAHCLQCGWEKTLTATPSVPPDRHIPGDYGGMPGDAEGCDVSPSCLDCPLSQCKHDNPKGYLLYVKLKAHSDIIEEFNRHSEDMSRKEAARRTAAAMDVHPRQVFRILAMQREAELHAVGAPF